MAAQSATRGPIEPDVLYPIAELKARSGLGQQAFRTARQTGLRVCYAGNRCFCLGRDFIEWVQSNGTGPNSMKRRQAV